MFVLKPLASLSIFLLVSAVATSANAALGQSPSRLAGGSLPLNARALALVPAAKSALFAVQETQLENGTTVREYARPSGVVFAVAWQGPVLPDLDVLLGSYFNTFKLETDQARLDGRRGAPVDMARDGLVLRSNGRMRNFFGHAYVIELIPAGVNIKDVLE